jgi:hypothetical protein
MIRPTQETSLGFALSASPIVEVFSNPVYVSSSPTISSTDFGAAFVMTPGCVVSCLMPQAVNEYLTFCFWLRTDTFRPAVNSDGVPSEIQATLLSCSESSSGDIFEQGGWAFSRIQRTDGISDYLFSQNEGGVTSSFRFSGNDTFVWQFVVLQLKTGSDQKMNVHVDGHILEKDTEGIPAPFGIKSNARNLRVNRQFASFIPGVVSVPSMGDCMKDLVVTTMDIEDASFMYDLVSAVGASDAFVAAKSILQQVIPGIPVSSVGVAGVAETSYGTFAVREDGKLFGITGSQFDAVRNLKSVNFPVDIKPFKVVENSTFSNSPTQGLKLTGSGAKFFDGG